MCKKFLSTLIVVATLSSTSYTALADNLSQTEKSHEQHKAQYQQLNNEITSLNSELSKLNGQIENLNNKLAENDRQINSVQSDIKDTQVNLDETKQALNNQQAVFGTRVRNIYKQGSTTNKYLEILLTSKNLSDFLSRANAITTMLTLDKKEVSEIDSKKKAIDKTMNELDNKEKTLQELKSNTEKDKSQLNEKKKKQEDDLTALNKQREQVASIIEANEKQLISNSVNTINSANDVNNIKSAISNLKQIIPQLTIDSVKNSAKKAISNGEAKIESLNASSNFSANHNIAPNRGGSKKTLSMVATAYSDGLLTAMGLKPIRNPGGLSTVAVDPNVIPLGSKVYVSGYGEAIASDTGGVIKGNKIDLYMNSKAECTAFGRRTVTVSIIAYPGEW